MADLRCPACHSPATSVRDSRPATTGDYIRRRRQCKSCKARFSTHEFAVEAHSGNIFAHVERTKTALRSALHHLSNVTPDFDDLT